MTQNSISMHSEIQTSKNRPKITQTPPGFGLGAKIAVSVRNRFCSPPAKADIATAILTNVIEHLQCCCFPPISTPSPPKRCGQIISIIEGSLEVKFPTIWTDGNAQPGRSSGMEKIRREKIRDGEDQKGRPSEERRCRCAKR